MAVSKRLRFEVLRREVYATTRRRFQRAGLVAAAEQLRAWGCTAHVERAEVGAWEAIP